MNNFICEIKLNGIKNINKEITLKFSDVIVKPYFNMSNTNVKAIYGPNGSGKSGIITAMYIYKKLALGANIYLDLYLAKLLAGEINRENNELMIEVTFLNFEGNKDCYDMKYKTKSVIKHFIRIVKEGRDISFKEERISLLTSGNSLNNKFKTLLHVLDGQVMESELINDKVLNRLKELTNRNLKYNSVVLFSSDFKETTGLSKIDVLNDTLRKILFLGLSMKVLIGYDDDHTIYFYNRREEEHSLKLFDSGVASFYNNFLVSQNEKGLDEIEIDDLDKYQENVDRLAKFIKVFKPNLVSIDLDIKVNGDIYVIDKIMNYGKDGRFNIEFESSGIKKLVKLYDALKSAANGEIVFIDEFDANLHDVYFNRLVEFFRNSANGQLVFTTHNLEPIEVLEDNKHSLDFLSLDSHVETWTKNGHKSALQYYKNGLISHSTFNINSFDFEESLKEDELL